MNTTQALQQAIQHHQAGRLDAAEAIYRQILSQDPNFADALQLLGVIAKQTGHNDAAIELIGAAVHLKPDFAEGHHNLAAALKDAGRLDDAVAAYRRAIQLKPDHAESYSNLGNALKDQGKLEQAIANYRRAIELKPDYAEAYFNLGIGLVSEGKLDDAIAEFHKAIHLKPDFAQAHNNLGNAYWSQIRPDLANPCYERALALNSNLADAHVNLALACLAMGDYRRGWREYDWRWKVPGADLPPKLPQPLWDGKPLNGRTILLHAEQGYGDSIHFFRYALIAQHGGRLILGCQPEMARLLGHLPGLEQIVTSPLQLPHFDVQCSLPSLPMVMGLGGPEDVPWNGPYLKSDAETRAKFADVIEQGRGKLKVGLIWSGRAKPAGRSIPLKMLAPLAHPSVQFYSLQLGGGAQEAKSPPAGMNLIDVTWRIRDFADTAALMDQLDLIVSIDTAAAQLAGALGKPVWTMLIRVPDWRWLIDRQDSPWYPTMRLFRQKTAGDWAPVIESVAEALREFVSRSSIRQYPAGK